MRGNEKIKPNIATDDKEESRYGWYVPNKKKRAGESKERKENE